jgi:hypothetical protein
VFFLSVSDVLLSVPNNGFDELVMCTNFSCYASFHGYESVVKINSVIRCLCCGKVYDSGYYFRELKKGGSKRG